MYSVECISHGESKYGHEIPQFWHFLQNLLNLRPVVCTRLSHGGVKNSLCVSKYHVKNNSIIIRLYDRWRWLDPTYFQSYRYINNLQRGHRFHHLYNNICFGFLKCSKFHNFLNQYQPCLYLFECISHGDSKYSHQISEFWHFCDILYYRLLTPAAWKGLRVMDDVRMREVFVSSVMLCCCNIKTNVINPFFSHFPSYIKGAGCVCEMRIIWSKDERSVGVSLALLLLL